MLADFAKNKNMKKFQIFDQDHGLTPLENRDCLTFFDFLILESKNTFFFLEYRQKHISQADFANNKSMEKFQIFDQNHGLTPLEKFRVFGFF